MKPDALRGTRRRTRLHPIALLLALFVAAGLLHGCGRRGPATAPSGGPAAGTGGRLAGLTVRFLDVGQGDATLLQWDGRAALIDGGPQDDDDALLAALRRHGVDRLDWVFASHPHEDHIGGLVDALRAVPVEHFVDSGYNQGSNVQARLLKEIRKRDVDFRLAEAGETLDLGGGLRLEILAPPDKMLDGTESDANNNSVIARLTYGETRFLFTGDVEEEGRAALMQRAPPAALGADVLKVAHHGSHNGTDPAFLRAVQPEIAVISAARGNSYGHPHREALADLKRAGVDLYRTDRHGTITMETDGQDIEVTTARAAKGDVWTPGRRSRGNSGR